MDSLENLSNAEVVDYVVSSLETISQLKEANRQLEEKVTSLQTEKVELEKVASIKEVAPSFFDEECLDKARSTLESISFFDKQASEDFKEIVKKDPNEVLTFLQKIAFAMSSTSSQGELTNTLPSNDGENNYGDWGFLSSPQQN